MDDNNSNQQAKVQPQTAPLATPVAPSPLQMDSPKNGNKIVLLAGLAFIMLIIVIGIYFFASQYNASSKIPQPTFAPIIPNSPTPTAAPTMLDEKDIDNVDIPNPETELKPIDEDVMQL